MCWDVTLWSLKARYEHFGGTFFLDFWKVEESLTALTLITIVLIFTLLNVMSYNVEMSEFIKNLQLCLGVKFTVQWLKQIGEYYAFFLVLYNPFRVRIPKGSVNNRFVSWSVSQVHFYCVASDHVHPSPKDCYVLYDWHTLSCMFSNWHHYKVIILNINIIICNNEARCRTRLTH